MKERPILFNGEMVRAILEGRKTQTRRIVKNQPCGGWAFDGVYGKITSPHPQRGKFGAFLRRGVGTSWPELGILPCPFGQQGDRLWVRETSIITPKHHLNIPDDFSIKDADGDPRWVQYLATEPDISGALECCLKITPSIHMPRWASRITLEITGIRVERLNEISNLDCFAEGLPSDTTKGNRTWFSDLWESINGAGSWRVNPWVWVIEFRKVEDVSSAPNSLQPKPLTAFL